MGRKRGGERTWKSWRLDPGPPSSHAALGLRGPNLELSQEEPRVGEMGGADQTREGPFLKEKNRTFPGNKRVCLRVCMCLFKNKTA